MTAESRFGPRDCPPQLSVALEVAVASALDRAIEVATWPGGARLIDVDREILRSQLYPQVMHFLRYALDQQPSA